MLATVSSLVAVLFVVGAVGLVVGLIVIGVRQRLELQIPPPTWSEPPPMSPTQRKAYFGLLFIGLGFWVVGAIGAFTDVRWLSILGFSVVFATLVARLSSLALRVLRRDTRNRRLHEELRFH